MAITKKSTFLRGVHVPDMKALSSSKAIEAMPAPKIVYISMAQHIGKPARPCVSVGDRVLKGQLVGEESGFISANIYSSVAGTVKEIKTIKTFAGASEYVVIENDGSEEEDFLPDVDENDGVAISERIRTVGMVGLGGAGFPTYVKIATTEPIDTVLINGAECEPYLTCDHRVMIERAEDVVKGALYISKALKGARVIIGIEENKPDAIERLGAFENVTVVPLKKKYPQGSEKQLIYACTKRSVAPGKLPASQGVCVFNVQTALQTYEAVAHNRALYQRVMTVTGGGIKEPKNIIVRNGTPYQEIIDFCGGLNDDACKIVAGGPMMGKVLSAPVGYTRKTDSGLLVLEGKKARIENPSACINCGRCAKACPMHLMPMYMDLFTHTGDYEKADYYGVSNCFECGTCAYVCPAKRDLVGSIQLAKRKLRELRS